MWLAVPVTWSSIGIWLALPVTGRCAKRFPVCVSHDVTRACWHGLERKERQKRDKPNAFFRHLNSPPCWLDFIEAIRVALDRLPRRGLAELNQGECDRGHKKDDCERASDRSAGR